MYLFLFCFKLNCNNNDHFRNELCKSWKFYEYCSVPNTSNAIDSIEPKNLQKNNFKSNKKYYNDDLVYLYADILMNHTEYVI